MRQFIFVAFALLASAGLALAGSPSNPDWVRNSQGNTPIVVQVACEDNDALLAVTDTAGARRLTFVNETAAKPVQICPGTDTCVSGTPGSGTYTHGVRLDYGGPFIIVEFSADSTAWRCDGVEGDATTVSVLIEK